MRAFIAIELSDSSRVRIAKKLKNLQRELADISIRWLPVENIHLTLKFFKDLREEDVKNVGQAMKEAMGASPSFELQMGGLGAYPNTQKASVIWVSMAGRKVLGNLKTGLEEELIQLGYPTEKRPFSPHLTLGRVRRGVEPKDLAILKKVIEHQRQDLGSTIKVNEIVLFRSELKSTGAKYSKLHSAKAVKNDKEFDKR
jgi:2'-5' RNA ligase